MHVDDVGRRVEVVAPDLTQQITAGGDLTAQLHQHEEEPELDRREIEPLPVDAGNAPLRFDRQTSDLQAPRLRVWAPFVRAQPSRKFRQREWFYQVVVGSLVEPLHPILDGPSRGEHENESAWRAVAKSRQRLVSRSVRQRDVEDGGLEVLRIDHPERGRHITGDDDLVSLAEQPRLHRGSSLGIVFEEQDLHGPSAGGNNRSWTTVPNTELSCCIQMTISSCWPRSLAAEEDWRTLVGSDGNPLLAARPRTKARCGAARESTRTPMVKRTVRSRSIGVLGAASLGLWLACSSPVPQDLVPNELAARTGHSAPRPPGEAFEIPDEVDLGDGLDEEEAVALALWNGSEFRRALALLAVAEADVRQAELLPNPRLILQFPVSAKQLEWTLGWALDALWTRSPRVASARHAWGGAAQRVVEVGLSRAAATRAAFADASTSARLAINLRTRAELAMRLAAITAERARRGEASELASMRMAVGALQREDEARSARIAADDARRRLFDSIGAGTTLEPFALADASPLPPLGDARALREEAMRARPALLAARADLEAAAEVVGFEKRAIVQWTALLDSNGGAGRQPFDVGPGLDIELPLFDRNQAGIARAAALFEEASWAYAGLRRRIESELLRTHSNYAEALAALERWTREAEPAFQRSLTLAHEAEQQGSISYARVAEAQASVLVARARSIELEAIARRSLIELETTVGRRLDES